MIKRRGFCDGGRACVGSALLQQRSLYAKYEILFKRFGGTRQGKSGSSRQEKALKRRKSVSELGHHLTFLSRPLGSRPGPTRTGRCGMKLPRDGTGNGIILVNRNLGDEEAVERVFPDVCGKPSDCYWSPPQMTL